MCKSCNLNRWDVTGKREVKLNGYKLGRIRATEVHLEFLSNGVCGSDTHMFNTGAVHSGHKGPHQPLTLGHELVARVKRVGSKVTSLEAGDVVAVEPGLPCGECAHCRKGRYHCCPHTRYMGTPPQNGGLADEFYWPAKWCHKLPEKLAADPVLASLVEPLAACRQAWQLRNRIAAPMDDEWSVIVGSGAMALGVLAIIKATRPHEKVMVLARSAKDLQFATDFGADATFQLSNINPDAIATAVADELSDLFDTDHFDSDEGLEESVKRDNVKMAAVRAARETAHQHRSRGAHKAEIKTEMWRAAQTAASKLLIEANAAVLKQAQKKADGFITSLFECTGNERLLETIIKSQILLGDGCIIGLGCHYGVSFDAAHLRRLELAFQPVRRSCAQFPATIQLLSEKPDLFSRLIGGTVKFSDFGKLMNGECEVSESGTGGPKVVVVK